MDLNENKNVENIEYFPYLDRKNIDICGQDCDYYLVNLEEIRNNFLINYYKIKYKIYDKDSKCKIIKLIIKIKEVPFTFYLVFNDLDEQFKEGLKSIIQTINMVSFNILDRIKETSVVVKQDFELDSILKDKSKIKNRVTYAYTINSNNSIVVFANIKELVILHEIGHVYDSSFIRNKLSSRHKRFYDFFPLLDSYYVNWSSLILLEGNNLLSKLDLISAYSLKDYFYNPSEYFADCFSYYYMYEDEREEFRNIAPRTYEVIETILGYSRKVYKK